MMIRKGRMRRGKSGECWVCSERPALGQNTMIHWSICLFIRIEFQEKLKHIMVKLYLLPFYHQVSRNTGYSFLYIQLLFKHWWKKPIYYCFHDNESLLLGRSIYACGYAWIFLWFKYGFVPYLLYPWRYSSEEPWSTEAVAARWQYKGPCG